MAERAALGRDGERAWEKPEPSGAERPAATFGAAPGPAVGLRLCGGGGLRAARASPSPPTAGSDPVPGLRVGFGELRKRGAGGEEPRCFGHRW